MVSVKTLSLFLMGELPRLARLANDCSYSMEGFLIIIQYLAVVLPYTLLLSSCWYQIDDDSVYLLSNREGLR